MERAREGFEQGQRGKAPVVAAADRFEHEARPPGQRRLERAAEPASAKAPRRRHRAQLGVGQKLLLLLLLHQLLLLLRLRLLRLGV